ncbi:MAG: NUDIX hydrolase [Candidatus Viridilinea halotolerans]|uniref:NUDIX hydrolase n=1 Tax=Candidatus Viridilinea halotolerans TaxID=2491704 RepID=A0A426U717_9CHLR|nr:MAG: NUDIX hydrolase [Candidatus Viridilinea halotolerans]
METWIERNEVFNGPIFRVLTGTARLDDGQVARRDMVAHRGGVGVVPILGDQILLVRQFRLAVNKPMLEIPAGLREPNEAAEACAARELAEELGYAAGQLIPLVTYHTSPGFTDESTAIFLALDLTPTVATPDWDERLTRVEQPLAHLATDLAAGIFEDGKTIIGLYAAQAWWQRQQEEIRQ